MDLTLIGFGSQAKIYRSGNNAIKIFVDKYWYEKERDILLNIGTLYGVINMIDHDDVKQTITLPLAELDLYDWMFKDQSLKNIATVMIKLIHALQNLHDYGYVHRDIKPENILIINAKTLDVVISDLAFCVPIDSKRGMAGTKGYIAPEVSAYHKYNGREDIYALACVWFELLRNSSSTHYIHKEMWEKAQDLEKYRNLDMALDYLTEIWEECEAQSNITEINIDKVPKLSICQNTSEVNKLIYSSSDITE